MDPSCRALLEKYVRSDSVIACLELAGYTSDVLLRNVDSNQIDQIEDFVRHACSVMGSALSRTYLGTVFFTQPGKFCFPIGVRMGIMHAANDLKTAAQLPRRRNASVQTDGGALVMIDLSEEAPHKATLSRVRRAPLEREEVVSRLSTHSSIDLTNDDNCETYSPQLAPSKPECALNHSGQASALRHEFAAQLDHLRAHSSASAIRLVSRQFVNARLIQDHHFDIDMEIAPLSEGPPRITGIFRCHICREKRTRSTAVRFSVSRNRYPVMSNVLSHLKTHFQTRPPSSSSPSTTLPIDKAPSSVKREITACSDSSTSLSSFNLDHLLTNVVSLSTDIKF